MTIRAGTTRLNLDSADAAWDALAQRLESFATAWQDAPPSAIAPFAPDGPPGVRRMALVELVKYDMEQRWLSGDRRRLEDYFAELPELVASGGPPVDLLYEELHCRRHAGEATDAAEYFVRYPEVADALRRLLGMERTDLGTVFYTAPRVEELEPGTRIDDFDLLARLGRGAFATVFLARQRSMQRMVALKVSADHGREPQTLAQLDHPHIVRVFDQRLLPERRMRLLYMQYVAGGTLQEALEQVRARPRHEWCGKALVAAIDEALSKRGEASPIGSTLRESLLSADWAGAVCTLGAHLAEALSYAHDRGVLHRDLKPANVLLTAEGAAQLVDFNISFCARLDGAAPAAYFGGSLAYMSPEQLEACHCDHPRKADELDGRADVYSLAVILWEMLIGERPQSDERLEEGWTATLDAMIERRRAGVDAAAVDALRQHAPAALADLLVDCLSAEADARPSSASAVARRLRLCQHPHVERLTRPSAHRAARLALHFPLVALLLAAIVPNGVAAVFNFVYNRAHIVEHLDAQAADMFWTTQTAVNATAFPLGMIWLFVLGFPLAKALRRASRGERLSAEYAAAMRARALGLGQITALVGIALWSIAGIVYPAAMHWGGAGVDWHDYLHFIASLALGGLIAAAYPFFIMTWLATRAYFPALFRLGEENPADRDGRHETARLGWVERLTWRYLALAAALPMLGVTVMVTLGGEHADRTLLAILSVSSLVGSGLVYLVARNVQRDLAGLAEMVSPPRRSST